MQKYWLWYAMLKGISVRKKLALLSVFSTPESIFLTNNFEAYPQVTPAQAEILSNKDLTDAEVMYRVCNRKGIVILPFDDPAYPARLRSIPNPPLILYYRGLLPDFSARPAIGVVGTRKSTSYGNTMAQALSCQIAQCGGIVVSGGAKGVDAKALAGALEAEGPAVAVLGSGVDVEYPVENRPLFAKLMQTGCLISEYPPGTKPNAWQFPERNRIISGMSNGTLVIEAPKVSGALITAEEAMKQGRDVFVVPGNIDMETCAGSNNLLRAGAMAVFSGWDMLSRYAPDYPETVFQATSAPIPQTPQNPASDKKAVDNQAPNAYIGNDDAFAGLEPQERALMQCLDHIPRLADEVVMQAGIPLGSAMRIITKLAMDGWIVSHPGKMISAKKR